MWKRAVRAIPRGRFAAMGRSYRVSTGTVGVRRARDSSRPFRGHGPLLQG